MDPKTEGRLIAMRQVMAMLVAGQDRQAILAALARPAGDGQEDPGAVLDEGFALEAALAEERRALAREIRLRMEGH